MNGKGDAPRNCFSKQFKDNYETINWSKKKPVKTSEQEAGKGEQALQQATEGIPSRLSDVQGVR
jgi:hypothetical protein